MNNTDREKLLNKIQALLNKADTGRGASEAEAQAFLAKAQELMAKHGIEEMDLAMLDDGTMPAFDIGHDGYDTGHVRRNADIYVSRVLRKAFGVDIVFSEYRENGSSKNKCRMVIMGDKLDRDIARMVAPMIYETMMRGYHSWVKLEGMGYSVGHERDYCQGVSDGYLQASDEGKDHAMAQLSKEQKEQFGLIIANKEGLIVDYKKQLFPKLGSIGMKARPGSASARSHGFATGSRMTLTPTKKLK
jgi:hypothetical protein